jgi:hypothetical protein
MATTYNVLQDGRKHRSNEKLLNSDVYSGRDPQRSTNFPLNNGCLDTEQDSSARVIELS